MRSLKLGSLPLAALVFLILVGAGDARVAADTVTITSGPAGTTTSTTATFTFVGTGAVTAFRCLLDNARVASECTSPTTYSGLVLGGHKFTVYGYRGSTPVGVSDSWRWNIVAAPPPGPAPPPAPPPPPPPPAFAPKLDAPAHVPPGGVALLDASTSSGDIVQFLFDVDGNGSYETKCGKTSKAAVSYAHGGTFKVSVQAIDAAGEKKTATDTVVVSGVPAKPPAGAKPLAAGLVVAGCVDTDLLDAAIKLYECPTTVELGVAEAIFPPWAPSGSCFKRTFVGKGSGQRELLVASWHTVWMNGVNLAALHPEAGTVTLDTTIGRVYTYGPGGAAQTKTKATFTDPLGDHVNFSTGEFTLDWDVSKPSVLRSRRPAPGSSRAAASSSATARSRRRASPSRSRRPASARSAAVSSSRSSAPS